MIEASAPGPRGKDHQALVRAFTEFVPVEALIQKVS